MQCSQFAPNNSSLPSSCEERHVELRVARAGLVARHERVGRAVVGQEHVLADGRKLGVVAEDVTEVAGHLERRRKKERERGTSN